MFQRLRRHSASPRSAKSTHCTRLLNTRRERTALLHKENVVMTANNQVMVDRPSRSSTKRSACSVLTV
ncbi:unnamed protein product [Cuscuta campestris]|uniref:Uncharacterized protein n=1 Tax=Cuscuta campestris TaxID=132261 RepID=A0A484K030_9ASTE|nr:unnamed protein product [Cuscuta campestris]